MARPQHDPAYYDAGDSTSEDTMTTSDTRITEADYLAQDAESEVKHEFSGGEIIAMTGVSNAHSIITTNTVYRLYDQLMQDDCIVHSSDMRVQVREAGAYRYPDITIVCGEPLFADTTPESLQNPVVLIEVLSESTQQTDREQKLQEYLQIASLQEYLLIAQNEPRIERYLRQTDSEEWLYVAVDGLDASLELPSVACRLHLRDVYRRIAFDAAQATDTDSDTEN